VGLAYHGEHATTDLDLWEAEQELWSAVERAQPRSATKAVRLTIWMRLRTSMAKWASRWTPWWIDSTKRSRK
jgi:hypothetical protein